ncbi:MULTISPECIES: hypothetical protein [Exiguobacterium]|jgi:hypothetical protein|uniref:Uncharacterized protein n=1 Tax=Exiguobacterium sp. (strain ATCC BAA-1283 / AT1b) TaxID=360911 RepID=C4KZH1_EXISA|nr:MULTISPECIES: hypothetical protein [unclassified Exiguobacterium]ACQ70484.1 hypothetical protein EAT1b_1558 [Exiguobacterium sp. AT1b]MCC9621601.1 hypothetical protein [Thalassospira sp. MA62]
MSSRLTFALIFLGLFLVAVYWMSTWNDNMVEGQIERVDIPQILIESTESSEEVTLRVILINDQTEVTGIVNSVQGLQSGQLVTIEVIPTDSNLNIARTIEVTAP